MLRLDPILTKRATAYRELWGLLVERVCSSPNVGGGWECLVVSVLFEKPTD